MESQRAHCSDFKPKPTAAWLCAWWESEETEAGTEWFCSRPAWEERVCATRGLRVMPRADQEEDSFE